MCVNYFFIWVLMIWYEDNEWIYNLIVLILFRFKYNLIMQNK